MPDNYVAEFIREIRGIIHTFARESWKVRCATVYSPEEEQKRKQKTDTNKTHASYMKRMKANNNMNITRVMNMTMQERKKLLQRMEHRKHWKQVSLKALEFFTENEINNKSEPILKKKEQCVQYKKKLTKELGRSNQHLRG